MVQGESSKARSVVGAPSGMETRTIPLTPKLKVPETFDGTRDYLKPFILQLELYIGFYNYLFAYLQQKIL